MRQLKNFDRSVGYIQRGLDRVGVARSCSHSRASLAKIRKRQTIGEGMTLSIEHLDDLRRRRERILAGGGAEKLAERHAKRLMTARDRLDALFQEGTFQEIGTHVQHSARYFGREKKVLPADGVVVGTGYVGGRVVAAFAQDFTVVGVSLGKAHA